MKESQIGSGDSFPFHPASLRGLQGRTLGYLARTLQITLKRQNNRVSQLCACSKALILLFAQKAIGVVQMSGGLVHITRSRFQAGERNMGIRQYLPVAASMNRSHRRRT
jgi:hypothetical protein